MQWLLVSTWLFLASLYGGFASCCFPCSCNLQVFVVLWGLWWCHVCISWFYICICLHLTLSLFPASSSACPLHYTHEPPLGCSSFSPVLQLHIQHHLSSKVTIFHLHMSKPSQPDLYNFICLFVCLFLSLYSYFISLCGDFAFLCSSFSGFASIWCLFTPLVPFLLHLFSGFAFARHWGRHTPWQAQLRAPKPYSSWCIVGLYVKPTWQPPAPEHSLRSACLFWSLQQPVGPAPSPTCWGMWARTDPGGRTAPAERGSGPNCSPVCAKGEAGCWAAPSCWVEVWVYIRLWSCPSSSTWPRRRGR